MIFDITSRKEMEEEAKRATQLLDNVSQVTDDLIYVKDRESRLLFANPAMHRLTGRAPLGKDTRLACEPRGGRGHSRQ